MVQLSVIVPAYNAEAFLKDCIDSITIGTYQDFEILLIDDGSTDETGSICDRLQKSNPKIKVFHTENRGLAMARNLGLDHASGKYIGFVDADDRIAPDMYEKLVCAMHLDVQLSSCRFSRCQRDSIPTCEKGNHTDTIENQIGAVENVLCNGFGPYVWNKLFCRSVLDKYHIRFRPDSKVAEDQFFIMEYLCHVSKASFLSEKLYYYVKTDGSIMNTFKSNRIVDDKYISLPRAWSYTAEIVEDMSNKLSIFSQSRAAMFYNTVLRKLDNPDKKYIQEAVDYVKKHKSTLLHYRWGLKYYLSSLLLGISYPLWASIFRRVSEHERNPFYESTNTNCLP